MKTLAAYGFLLALLTSLNPSLLTAQVVVAEGAGRERATRILHEILARGRYEVISRDTVLPAAHLSPGDLLVYDADVRLEGRVEGSVAVVNGAFFIRPGAHVAGPIAVIGGGAYPSALAESGEIVELPANRAVTAELRDDTVFVRIRPPPAGARVVLPGAFGVRRFSYDRVNALSVAWGPEWRITGREAGAAAGAWASYHTARRSIGGGATLRVPISTSLGLQGSVARSTATNDAWIRSDLASTLEVLVLGRDVRNYYETDRAELTLARRPAAPMIDGAYEIRPYITLHGSRDSSLDSRAPWALPGRAGLERPNPAIADGTLVSLVAGSTGAWRGSDSRLTGEMRVEQTLPAGDFSFTQWSLRGGWEMAALWGHRIFVSAHALGTVGDEAAPPQRWSHVGGLGTIPTLPAATLRGDQLIFIESVYEVPLPFVSVPVAGSPTLRLVHATGTAWQTGTAAPAWEQSLGAGIQLSVVRTHLWVDPAVQGLRPALLLEFSFR
ncbi:MAG: hypothetical protein H0X65_02750 [Gemmatimonadetes bacterium]|nr:hypothetical protein [Gemmatimonadota bacterium]